MPFYAKSAANLRGDKANTLVWSFVVSVINGSPTHPDGMIRAKQWVGCANQVSTTFLGHYVTCWALCLKPKSMLRDFDC